MVSKDEDASLKVAAGGLKVFEKNDKKVCALPHPFLCNSWTPQVLKMFISKQYQQVFPSQAVGAAGDGSIDPFTEVTGLVRSNCLPDVLLFWHGFSQASPRAD